MSICFTTMLRTPQSYWLPLCLHKDWLHREPLTFPTTITTNHPTASKKSSSVFHHQTQEVSWRMMKRCCQMLPRFVFLLSFTCSYFKPAKQKLMCKSKMVQTLHAYWQQVFLFRHFFAIPFQTSHEDWDGSLPCTQPIYIPLACMVRNRNQFQKHSERLLKYFSCDRMQQAVKRTRSPNSGIVPKDARFGPIRTWPLFVWFLALQVCLNTLKKMHVLMNGSATQWKVSPLFVLTFSPQIHLSFQEHQLQFAEHKKHSSVGFIHHPVLNRRALLGSLWLSFGYTSNWSCHFEWPTPFGVCHIKLKPDIKVTGSLILLPGWIMYPK